MVDALPVLRMVISTERRPSTRTKLVCGAAPSRTLATSRTNSVVRLRCESYVIEIFCFERTGVQSNGVFGLADFLRTAWRDQILRADGIAHVARRKALGAQRRRVDVYLNLTLYAAGWKGYGCACTVRAWDALRYWKCRIAQFPTMLGYPGPIAESAPMKRCTPI